MRKIIVLIGFILMFTVQANAATTPAQKLGRGVLNIVSAPVEIPKEIRAHWIKGSEKTPHILVWLFCGSVKGAVMTVARVGSGAWDVVTFPLNVPHERAPLLKPDNVFQEWPARQEGVIYKNLGDQ